MRGDVCTFVRRRKKRPVEHGFLARSDLVLTIMVISHADDLLYVGNPQDYQIFLSVMNRFRHGEANSLSASTPFVFCGVQISISRTGVVELGQLNFPDSLKPTRKENLIRNGMFSVSREKRRKECKSFAGAALWLMQTRYDVAFAVSHFQNTLTAALDDEKLMLNLIALSTRICKTAQSHRIGLSYFPM